jgi:voltage-gated potassium channel Kch
MATDPIEEAEEVVEDAVAFLRHDLMGSDGYFVVLMLTILSLVMIPIDETFRLGPVVTAFLLGLLVLVTLTRSHVHPLLRKMGIVVVGTSVVLAVIIVTQGHPANTADLSTGDRWLVAAGSMSYCLVLALCFPAILRRTFSHRKVTLNTVAASLAAYLLIGLIFTAIYRFVNVVDGPFFSQSPVNGFTYEYFSYVTLTTVGYGDYTAAIDAGRTLAMLEALFGQVFLVTIVALVVSNLGQEHVGLRRGPDDPANPADPADPVDTGGTDAH